MLAMSSKVVRSFFWEKIKVRTSDKFGRALGVGWPSVNILKHVGSLGTWSHPAEKTWFALRISRFLSPNIYLGFPDSAFLMIGNIWSASNRVSNRGKHVELSIYICIYIYVYIYIHMFWWNVFVQLKAHKRPIKRGPFLQHDVPSFIQWAQLQRKETTNRRCSPHVTGDVSRSYRENNHHYL